MVEVLDKDNINIKMRKGNKGFTLIELLVVIAIIGILSSVVLASLNSARKKARDARRVADIKQIQLALEMYFDANRAYPTTLAPLATTFIAVIPVDPLNSGSYTYRYSGLDACLSYHLRATLEETTNPALSSDVDAAAGTICSGSVADEAGTDPVYDVKP